MNLKITGLNFDVTEAIKNHVSSKLERISRHADNVISVTVTLSVEKMNNKAEVDVHLAGKDLHVEAVESDMYAAVDVLMDKLDRAILKHKGKVNDVRSAPAPAPVTED
ncbi:MAG: ribosome-associated translation inhibitor RaiA [Neisseria sp.]|nr:ribosome-associated translation inhibitor RaiA [Neisseria sp.]